MDNVSKREENTQQYRIRKLNEDLIIKLIYVIEGKIDIKEFKKAINSFYQDIINSFELEQVDISYLPKDEQEQYLSKSYLQNQNSYPQSEIAIKGKLIKQNSEKYYLEISGNPYVIDKQAQPLINMISNYSKNNSSNIEGSISYKEIIKRLSEFENSEDSFIGFQHWVEENQLENLEYFQEVDMPFVYENNDSKSTIQRIRKKFEDIEIDKIKATSEKLNLSISDIFLSGWYIWLSKYLSLEHIFVGVNYQGRSDNSSVNIGALDKIIPIEINVNKDLTFKEFAKGLCQKINDFKDYKECFTWQRVESALNCEKVIGIPFSFDHIKWKPFHRNNDLSIKLDDIYGVNEKFKMQLSIIENDDGLTADLYYDTSIASKQDFEVILNTYFVMLGDVLESENKRISELNLLDQRFYNLVVKEWNETESNYNINTCLHSLFEEQVKQTPKSVAIKYDNNYSLNYEQLNERANDLAHQLILNGVQKEEVIGIFMDRSPEVPIGSLGIMKTGAAYVPIDPKFPKERIYKILEDANCRFIITQSKYINDLENFKGIIIPVHLNKDIENGANLNLEVSSRNLAYCIYTSGSTGKPKGALIEHKNIVNHIFAIQEHIPFFENDNHAYLSTFAADVGHTVLYGSLLSGGTLHILSDEIASDPIQLEKYFNSNRIDFLKIVPSHLKSLFGDSPEKILPHKNILIGGEELRWNWVCHITSVNKCNVFNHYGPTETAVGTFIYKVTDKQTTKRAAPIGKPMSNTKAYILDAHQQPLPPGFIGELYIGGSSVGRGYLNNAESTNEKYISNPFIDTNEKMYRTGDRVRYLSNGNIEFIERVDHQVKIRGFRVEIGEIERAIETYMAVGEAVVLANENESGSNELYAYIVPVAPLEPFNINDLRNFLINKLPEYMIPTHFTTLDEFPLTINGKVDRKKISKLGNDDNNLNNNYVPPSTIIEQQLARIWEEVLGAEKLGIHDDFFQLGGHSLSAIQTITRLKNIFEIEISIRKIFEAPTIKQLSIVIEDLLVEAIEL